MGGGLGFHEKTSLPPHRLPSCQRPNSCVIMSQPYFISSCVVAELNDDLWLEAAHHGLGLSHSTKNQYGKQTSRWFYILVWWVGEGFVSWEGRPSGKVAEE